MKVKIDDNYHCEVWVGSFTSVNEVWVDIHCTLYKDGKHQCAWYGRLRAYKHFPKLFERRMKKEADRLVKRAKKDVALKRRAEEIKSKWGG